jgi:molybdenum cofactor cytidylyltransferase
MTLKTGIIILAAGASSRFGSPKQLLDYSGKSLIRHAACTALETSCRPVIVVLGANEEKVEEQVRDLEVKIAINHEWESGVGTSIKSGLEEVLVDRKYAELEAILFMSCDQPLITKEFLEGLAEARIEKQRGIVACRYAGTVGLPAVFEKKYFDQLQLLPASEGAKRVMLKHSEDLVMAEFPEGAMDIDTKADYERLTKSGK